MSRKWLEGALSGEGSSSRLSGSRPQIVYGDIWCMKCNQACEFDITGGHRLWSAPDNEGHTQGYLYIRADHHGEYANIRMTFQQARHFLKKRNAKIELFGQISALPPMKLVLPKLPLMLMETSSI